jgi:hypothetical protein
VIKVSEKHHITTAFLHGSVEIQVELKQESKS